MTNPISQTSATPKNLFGKRPREENNETGSKVAKVASSSITWTVWDAPADFPVRREDGYVEIMRPSHLLANTLSESLNEIRDICIDNVPIFIERIGGIRMNVELATAALKLSGQDGTALVRPSRVTGMYTISYRINNAISHARISSRNADSVKKIINNEFEQSRLKPLDLSKIDETKIVSLYQEAVGKENIAKAELLVHKIEVSPCFAKSMTREIAEDLLMKKPLRTFLIRESSEQNVSNETILKSYVLSRKTDDSSIEHVKLLVLKSGLLQYNENEYFEHFSSCDNRKPATDFLSLKMRARLLGSYAVIGGPRYTDF